MSFSTRTVATRQAFQSSIAAGVPAYWEIAPGVEFGLRREPHSVGLALQVKSEALRRNQMQQALERRFQYPQDYHGYFMFLDPQRAFVVWHALPEAPVAIELINDIQFQQLTLLGLEYLDDRAPTF
jgi:hypothetical protein